MTPDLSYSTPSSSRRPRASTSPPSPKVPGSTVIDIAINESASRLASAHCNGTVSLWKPSHNSEEWMPLSTIATRHEPNALRRVLFAPSRLSPDIMVTIGSDGIAVVYKLREQTTAQTMAAVGAEETVIRDARLGLTDAAFTEEGVLATIGEEGVVRIYQIGKRDAMWGLLAQVDVEVSGGVSFAPGGRYIVAGGVVVMRGVADWEWQICARAEGMGEGEKILCVDWGRSGWIGLGTEGGNVEVWHMKDGDMNRVAKMSGDGSRVTKLEWDRAGGVLASAHEDGKLRSWARLPGDIVGKWNWCLRDCVDVSAEQM
eukprot:GFKZ01001763.1.p1 GENE.GFKZ01001763.1~~GFKZ01001763.1.p1  ORF type:complete len:315 (+),score=42.50 GFKZ01001763.1:140-1084(+)